MVRRTFIQTTAFEKSIREFFKKKKLTEIDFIIFKKELAENPARGDLIPGTGGIRKIRLKSTTKGKSGGFRVCYFDNPEKEEIFLILNYAKNEQEDLSAAEKKTLKELAYAIKKKQKKDK